VKNVDINAYEIAKEPVTNVSLLLEAEEKPDLLSFATPKMEPDSLGEDFLSAVAEDEDDQELFPPQTKCRRKKK
jgi:hypothetical protein